MRRPALTLLALLFVQLAFAAQSVESKIAMAPLSQGGEAVDPMSMALMRCLGGGMFFLIVGRVRGDAWPQGKQWGRLALCALLGMVLNQVMFLQGLKRTGAVMSTLFGTSIPVFTAVLATLLGVERADRRVAVGLALASSGMFVLTGFHGMNWGAGLLALNCLCYAGYVVMSKGVLREVGPQTLVTWVFCLAALMLTPVSMPILVSEAPHYSARAWTIIAFILVVPTIAAYFFNAWALGRTEPSKVTTFVLLQPLFAALIDGVQNGRALPPNFVPASALIASGVLVVAARRPQTA